MKPDRIRGALRHREGTRVYLLLSLLLALFQGYVAYLVLNPQVSEEYRAYYITREADLSPYQRATLRAIQPGVMMTHETTQVAFDGWSVAEASHRWSLGRSASMVFLLDSQAAAEQIGELQLHFSTLGEQRVRIYLNGKQIYAESAPESGEVELIVPILEDVLEVGENVLRFELPDARPAGNGDTRALAVALKSINLG